MLFGIDYVFSFLTRAITLAKKHGYEAEAYYFGEDLRFMRSSTVGVHQSGYGCDGEVTLRMRQGGKEVVVNISSPADISSAISKGKKLMVSAKPNPLLYPLPTQPRYLPEVARGLQKIPRQFWDDMPAKQTAFKAIRFAEKVNPSWSGAGSFLTAAHEIGVANSQGTLRYQTAYYNAFTVVVKGGKRHRKLTTYAEGFSRLPQDLNPALVVEEAFLKARLTDELPLLQPLVGKERMRMDAILSPNCVADWISDAALAFAGYRSVFSSFNRFFEKI